MFDSDDQPEPRARTRHHGPAARGSMGLRDVFEAFRSSHPAVRRGDVRPLILAALQREPMHGYQVIQELEAQSGGRWRPSAGSVYPTLQQLDDEGLVRSEEIEGRRTYTVTEAGRAALKAAAPNRAPWSDFDTRHEIDIRRLALQLVGAVMQVSKMGSPRAKKEARAILIDARRQIYRVLADDPDEPEVGPPPRARARAERHEDAPPPEGPAR